MFQLLGNYLHFLKMHLKRQASSQILNSPDMASFKSALSLFDVLMYVASLYEYIICQ